MKLFARKRDESEFVEYGFGLVNEVGIDRVHFFPEGFELRPELLRGMGSADIASAAASDGFVEIPPHGQGAGPWPFWRWAVD